MIVVGPELEDFVREVTAAGKSGQPVTLTPLYRGDDKTGAILPAPVTFDPSRIRSLTETSGPIIRADGSRLPRREWWGGKS